MVYTFGEKLAEGQHYEDILDDYFGHWFDIDDVDMPWQKRGIDRIFTNPRSGQRYTVEYKTDTKAAETRNIFLETWSVYEDQKRGWLYTTESDFLIYYIPPLGVVDVYKPSGLRLALETYGDRYPEKTVQNKSYTGRGVPIPMQLVRAFAVSTPSATRPISAP